MAEQEEKKVKDKGSSSKIAVDGGKKKIIVIAVVAIVVIAILAYIFLSGDDNGNGGNGNGNRKPFADFEYTPDAIYANATVNFDASNSTDLDGDELIYSWDFGDPEATSSNPNTDNGVTASHKYTLPGEYTVTLVVDDQQDKDNTDTKSVNITVLVEETPSVTFAAIKPNNALTNIIWTITADSVDGTTDQLQLNQIRYNIYNGSDTDSVKLTGLLSSHGPTDKIPPYDNSDGIYFDDNGDSILSIGDTISIAGDGGAGIQSGDFYQLIYEENDGEMMSAEALP